MTTPRYRFIPFAFQEELAEQVASQTPVLGRAQLYTYDLPESSDETRNVVKKQIVCSPKYIQASSLQALKAEEIQQWAEANQKVILTPAYAPRLFRLKQGETTVWIENGETCLLVPLFKGTTDMLLCVRNSNTKYQIRWDCGFVLHLVEETGIRPLTGDLIFHYNLFRLAARGAVGEGVAGQEGEVNEPAGKAGGAGERTS